MWWQRKIFVSFLPSFFFFFLFAEGRWALVYEVRQGVGKQISLCAREFVPAQMVNGSYSCSHPCTGISMTSGLWQQLRFSSYFNIYKQRSKKQGGGVGHAFEEPCLPFLNVRNNFLSSKGPRVSPMSLACGEAASSYLIKGRAISHHWKNCHGYVDWWVLSLTVREKSQFLLVASRPKALPCGL